MLVNIGYADTPSAIADINSRGGPFAYNWENCQIAATLFQNQGGVKTQFWCEKGPYKK
jgi:hypothetical protein